MRSKITLIIILLLSSLPTAAFGFDLVAKQGADFGQNFYIAEGAQTSISSFALYDTTNTTVTSASHGLSDGDRVTIVNSDYYTGTYTVANATSDTFTIAKKFEATETKAKWMDALDLTGKTAEAIVWSDIQGTDEVADMGATVEDADGGHISVSLTDAEIDALTIGTYVYNLVLINADTTRDVLVSGRFMVKGRGTTSQSSAGTVVSVSSPSTVVTLVGARGPAGAGADPDCDAYGIDWDGDTSATCKDSIYDKIETLADGHNAVTLAADADAVLGLSTQEINLDTQTANVIFAGPESGAATDPTFRALVADDIPDLSSVYEPAGITESDISDLDHTATAITDGLIIEADLNTDNTPEDGDVLQYDSTGTNFVWVTCAELTGSADLCDGGDDAGTDDQTAAEVSVTTTAFGGNFANDTGHDTVQELLDIIDDLTIPAVDNTPDDGGSDAAGEDWAYDHTAATDPHTGYLKESVFTCQAIGSTTSPDVDLSGNVTHCATDTIDTGETTYTFSNPPASGTKGEFTLILTNGGSQTVNWPAAVDWEGGTAPTLTASGIDILYFFTIDAGTIWYGFLGGLDMQ